MSQPYFDNGIVQLYQADAREIPLPDGSVHCVVTSPPYFGLRVYQGNDDRGIGLEASIEAYVANLVDVFREVWRVLRDDGVCWVNLGDSYGMPTEVFRPGQGRADGIVDERAQRNRNGGNTGGNRLGIPERVVMALQADGWIWRDTVIWAKKSAMPESVNGWRWERCQKRSWPDQDSSKNEELRRDRQNGRNFGKPDITDCPGCPKCEANDGLVLRRGSWRTTSSHEYIYMLTKGMGYYCDAEAVKQNREGTTHGKGTKLTPPIEEAGIGHGGWERSTRSDDYSSRNRRSVWNDISPEPYGGAHFATFPSDLPRICIQASTSEKGACPECGSQWARVVERQEEPDESHKGSTFMNGKTGARDGGDRTQEGERHATVSVGWRDTCGHGANPVPATVLDPFCGTATTMLAAQKLGRRAVGTDISEAYLKQAVKRLTGVSLPLDLK